MRNGDLHVGQCNCNVITNYMIHTGRWSLVGSNLCSQLIVLTMSHNDNQI